MFSSLFAYLALAGLALWSVIHFYDLILLSKKLKTVRITEAAISYTKLKLKSKINSRISKLSYSTQLAADTKKEIIEIYQRMAALDFSKAHDFQLLFDSLQVVTPLLDLTPLGEIEIINQRSKNSELESVQILQLDNTFQNPFFWAKLYKYEPKILRYAYSISVLTLQARAAIHDYNFHLKNKHRSIQVPNAIEFQCFELLWNIVNEEDKRNSGTTKANLDELKVSA